MAETEDQIIGEIEAARTRLGYDLRALENRVKQNTDWRLQFSRRPWTFVGLAFGAALLMGLVVGHKASCD
jgi:ElaB/YqjD/DUF883 family membrane-anchored ribosome-binding protein